MTGALDGVIAGRNDEAIYSVTTEPMDQMTDLEQARQLAWKYIDYAPRTIAEVRRRLARAHCSDEDTEAVIADLVRSGALDDERFARDWTESRGERRGIGPVRLEAELRRKGVSRETAREALAPLDEEAQVAAALALAKRWLARSAERDLSARRRLAGYLQRRGYNWPLIEQVFARVFANSE
jgi:regulatory protein